jgi:hypothetical protein
MDLKAVKPIKMEPAKVAIVRFPSWASMIARTQRNYNSNGRFAKPTVAIFEDCLT